MHWCFFNKILITHTNCQVCVTVAYITFRCTPVSNRVVFSHSGQWMPIWQSVLSCWFIYDFKWWFLFMPFQEQRPAHHGQDQNKDSNPECLLSHQCPPERSPFSFTQHQTTTGPKHPFSSLLNISHHQATIQSVVTNLWLALSCGQVSVCNPGMPLLCSVPQCISTHKIIISIWFDA